MKLVSRFGQGPDSEEMYHARLFALLCNKLVLAAAIGAMSGCFYDA